MNSKIFFTSFHILWGSHAHWKNFPNAEEENIQQVYRACMNPDMSLSKDAINVLYDIFYINSSQKLQNKIQKTKNRLKVINWMLNPFKMRSQEELDTLAGETELTGI